MNSLVLTPRARIFAAVAAVVAVLDQVTKYLAVAGLTRSFGPEDSFGDRLMLFLTDRHPPRAPVVTVVENFFRFRYVENPGAAWGFLAGVASWFRTPFFLVVSVAAMAFIVSYFRKSLPDQRMLRVALALVFGGAVGNFLDRARLGYVIDFIDWHWYAAFTWPTFNIADVGISLGIALIVADMFINKPPAAPTDERAPAATSAEQPPAESYEEPDVSSHP